MGHPALWRTELLQWWIRDGGIRRACWLLEAHGLADVLEGLDGAETSAGGAVPEDGIDLFGIGLASAVFLDALIVRSVLVPGLMLVLGDWNWKLPATLDRVLPHLNVEGSAANSDTGAPAIIPQQQPVPEPAR